MQIGTILNLRYVFFHQIIYIYIRTNLYKNGYYLRILRKLKHEGQVDWI